MQRVTLTKINYCTQSHRVTDYDARKNRLEVIERVYVCVLNPQGTVLEIGISKDDEGLVPSHTRFIPLIQLWEWKVENV